MRMKKPYEEGSILLDAPQHVHDTRSMDELVELARDKGESHGAANAICPAKRSTTAVPAVGGPVGAAVLESRRPEVFQEIEVH